MTYKSLKNHCVMNRKFWSTLLVLFVAFGCGQAIGQESNTLPPLTNNVAPVDFKQMWAGFDPRAEPLETEILKEWEEEGIVLRVIRFRIGVFKGKKAMLAAIYGYPKDLPKNKDRLPGLVQIHGGGQYADYRACLMNAKRGYATVSIAWAGRISAPGYQVTPAEVKLFWDDKKDHPRYKVTTDWAAVDAYHAPSRNPKNNFPSAAPAEWTIDEVESPRNSPWFLCAIAARRALTFLEQQPEVDAKNLGVYGHSMGGKLTVMASVDSRVKAAAPSCGGISDRSNASKLFEKTIGDGVSLNEITCPIIFLSPANDFHGRISDLPRAVDEIKSEQWRVTCSPHRNHQDTAEFEVASLLWFDQQLKGTFEFPKTPTSILNLESENGIPTVVIHPDSSRKILAVDVYYTQHGKLVESRFDFENTKSRFWRFAKSTQTATDGGTESWTAKLPVGSTEKPLWVFANVTYGLDEPVAGAGYYYGIYNTEKFNVSSLIKKVTPDQLKAAGVKATLEPKLVIESFADGWEKEWFTYKPAEWPQMTHKLYDEQYRAPKEARLAIDVKCEQPNQLVVLLDQYAAAIEIEKVSQWQEVILSPNDFQNHGGESLKNWTSIRQLKLSDAERLRPARGNNEPARIIGKKWRGPAPQFRNLRWIETSTKK